MEIYVEHFYWECISCFKMWKNFTPSSIKFRQLRGCLMSDDMSVPGYIYEEAVKTTYKSRSECCEMLEVILSTFNDVSMPFQKLKVLKVLKYLSERGEPTFCEMLSRRDRLIKEATGFNGPSDQVYGSSLCVSVRNEAQALLTFIHSETRNSKPLMNNFDICGMGSTKSKFEKYDGFGSSQVVNTSVLSKVVSGITDLMDDLRNNGKDSAPEIDIQLRKELFLDSGSFQPVRLTLTDPSHDSMLKCKEPQQEPSKGIVPSGKVTPCKRAIGRPGGGWDDEEEEINQQHKDVFFSQDVAAKLEEVISFEEDEDFIISRDLESTDDEEQKFVSDVLLMNNDITSWNDLDRLIERCKVLSVIKIVNLFCQHLKTSECGKMNILQVIEAFIYNNIIPLETLRSATEDLILGLSNDNLISVKEKANKLSIIIEKLLKIET